MLSAVGSSPPVFKRSAIRSDNHAGLKPAPRQLDDATLSASRTAFRRTANLSRKALVSHERQSWPLPERERRQAVFVCALAGVSGAARLSLPFLCAPPETRRTRGINHDEMQVVRKRDRRGRVL